MENIKAKVANVLGKDKDSTESTTTSGTHNTHGNTHGTTHSDPTGPHDSHMTNKADPRVDSDQVGDYGNTTSTGGHRGHDRTGPHDSRLGNKSDPRVDSDQQGGYGNTRSTGGGYGSDPTGPHNTRTGNQLDPRVDSDNVGGYGNTQSTGGTGRTEYGSGATHGAGGLGQGTSHYNTHGQYSSDPNGPHDSRLANKSDPRTDASQPGAHTGGYGSSTGTGYSSTTGQHGTHGTHGTHNQYGSDPDGPHDSRLANKADPRTDASQPGAYTGGTGEGYGSATGQHGTHGTHGTHNQYSSGTGEGYGSTTGQHGTHNQYDSGAGEGYGSATGQHGGNHLPGPADGTAGPHKSNLMNKMDPRVDSNLDGSKKVGGDRTYG